jgi:hypothetical protein
MVETNPFVESNDLQADDSDPEQLRQVTRERRNSVPTHLIVRGLLRLSLLPQNSLEKRRILPDE